MPYITLTISAQPDEALSESIAARISALTAQHLRKDPELTAISVAYLDPSHWFVAGASLSSQCKRSFWLDIKVVDGTNTKAEIAAYLAAVYAAMCDLLKDVHPESYVLVHEVPAAAYGFGGLTQEHRFIAGRIAASTTAEAGPYQAAVA